MGVPHCDVPEEKPPLETERGRSRSPIPSHKPKKDGKCGVSTLAGSHTCLALGVCCGFAGLTSALLGAGVPALKLIVDAIDTSRERLCSRLM